jgi:DMSO/TMAO reductase YedYZ molybdopterin-dependent catalytic subunit
MLKVWISFLAVLVLLAVFAIGCSQAVPDQAPAAAYGETTLPLSSPVLTDPPSPTPLDSSWFPKDDPTLLDNSLYSITPVESLNITGTPPETEISAYRLKVDGLVDTPLSLDYDTIMKYPTYTEVVLLLCPEVFVDNAEWTGVPLSAILDEAGVKPEATVVNIYSGSYKIALPVEKARQDGVFLAHTVNGQVLPLEHGFPVRLVVKGQLGSKWVKWVDRIQVTDTLNPVP